MNPSFVITGINLSELQPYLQMSKTALIRNNAQWITADSCPGYPCRVSLEDATLGEEVLLFNYQHNKMTSPYAASGPVFIRKNAQQRLLATNEVPAMLFHRQLSLRAYDSQGMMTAAEVIQGEFLQSTAIEMLQNTVISYIDVHHAGPGCFACRINRV